MPVSFLIKLQVSAYCRPQLQVLASGKLPEEWNNSYIVSLFKSRGSALDRGNYLGLKLTDQVLKVVKRVIEKIIRECIVI